MAPLNLSAPPFHLPEPIRLIHEGCTQHGGSYPDTSLGLWKIADVRAALAAR